MRIHDGHNLLRLAMLFAATLIFTDGAAARTGDGELRELWKLAAKNLPGLQARRSELQALRQSLRALPKLYKPDVALDAGYSAAANPDENAHGPLARVTARWTLWDGGRNYFRGRLLKGRLESMSLKREVAAMEIKKDVARMYFDIIFLDALAKIQKDRDEQYARLIRLIRRRVRIGTTGYSNLEQVRLKREKLKFNRARTLRTTALLREQLAVFAGVSIQTVSGLTSAGLLARAFPAQSTMALRLENLPAFRAYRAQLRALTAGKRLARRELYWPSLALELYGGYGPHRDALDSAKPEVGAAIRFRFPLYSSRNRRARLAVRSHRLEAARLNLKQKLLREGMRLRALRGRLVRDREYLLKLKGLRDRSARNLKRGYRDFRRGLRGASDMASTVTGHYGLEADYARRLKQLYVMAAKLDILRSHANQGQSAKTKSSSQTRTRKNK